MKNTIKSAFFAVLAALLTLPDVGTEALGGAWPLRAVKLIVPPGPSSGTDVTARLLADQLSKRWGKSVVVENRSGAGVFANRPPVWLATLINCKQGLFYGLKIRRHMLIFQTIADNSVAGGDPHCEKPIRRLGAVLRKTIFDIYAAMPSSWNTPRMAARSAS
jgi:hypothetical protein